MKKSAKNYKKYSRKIVFRERKFGNILIFIMVLLFNNYRTGLFGGGSRGRARGASENFELSGGSGEGACSRSMSAIKAAERTHAPAA